MTSGLETDRPADWMSLPAPALRGGIRLGPPLWEGERQVWILSDPTTGGFLRLGEREAFLVSRLDGSTSPRQIGEAYADRFGRRLEAGHFQQLFTLLGRHGLLDPPPPGLLDALAARARELRSNAGRGPLLRRWPVPGLVRLVDPVARYGSWLLAAPVVVLGTLLGLLAVGAGLAAMPELLDSARHGWSSALVGVLVAWLLVCLHEFFHGVACLRYGGRPSEIGLMWRLPLVAPYCKVDDSVTFQRRSQRVMTAYAGVYVNLVAQAPLTLGWLLTRPEAGQGGGWWHAVLAVAMLANGASIVVNLLPVMQLDGYRMVEHALSALHLQRHTMRFWTLRGPARTGYPVPARRLYRGYGLLALLILVPLVIAIVTVWFRSLAGWIGPLPAAGVLLLEAVVLVALLRWALGRAVGTGGDQVTLHAQHAELEPAPGAQPPGQVGDRAPDRSQ